MENFKFENSCKTVILKTSKLFLSAYPGQIVFGEVNKDGYLYLKSFIFFHFQIFDFYIALLNIIKFLSASEIEENKGLIQNYNEEIVYFWIGKTVFENNEAKKLILIGIEQQTNIVFELSLNSYEINDLIKCFSEAICASLCLKTIEREFFDFISEENTSTVVSIRNKNKLKILYAKFEKQYNPTKSDILFSNLYELTLHYHELLIIIQKLKTFYNTELNKEKENSRIAALLE